MILLSLLTSLILSANAQTEITAKQWSNCLESYRGTKRILFDVAYNENDKEKHVMFRNGKNFSEESLHIYHDGQFWITPLKIETDFYKSRKAVAVLGGKKYCLDYHFHWVRADNMSLTPFNQKKCGTDETLDFKLEDNSTKPSASEVLIVKMKRDVEMSLSCMDPSDKICSVEDKQKNYQRMSSWNPKACEQLANPEVQKLITAKTVAVTNFIAQMSAQQQIPNSAAPQGSNK